MTANQRIVLASRPGMEAHGMPSAGNFRLEEAPMPEPGPGQVLVRNDWLSVDPYMRGRMLDLRSYAEPVALGAVMVGDTAGEVIASQHPAFQAGDTVVGPLGWQRYGLAEAGQLRQVDATRIPLSAYLGVAGMPGVTAHVGLLGLCDPQPGETVVVTAAAGAVGSAAGQLAQLRGCRVVGVAGGTAKCRHVTDELGFDACVDYRAGERDAQLKSALPAGVDCVFDNVGGDILAALIRRANHFARITLCGAMAEVNDPDPKGLPRLLPLITKRIRMQGFIVSDHTSRWSTAIDELSHHVAAGRIRYRETIADGLAAAPAALISLLHGGSLGKQLVRLG